MKKVTTAVLFAAISLTPVFSAGQPKPASTPSTVSGTGTAKKTTPAKKHGKRHHRKQMTTPSGAVSVKK